MTTPTDAPVVDRVEAGGPILSVRDLVKEFPIKSSGVIRRTVGAVHAVSGISFDIKPGETLGLVGESGCGKTTTIMEVMNLLEPQQGRIVVLGTGTADSSALV